MGQLLTSFLADDQVENVIVDQGVLTIEHTDATLTTRVLTASESTGLRAELSQLAGA